MSRLLLLVDDDLDVRDAFADLLELHGWTVAQAGDGLEALQWLAQNPAPAVILLDLKMPRCDGYQFRAAQLADERWRDIPTIVFSGDGSPDRAPLRGAHVVSKSAGFARLGAALEAVLR